MPRYFIEVKKIELYVTELDADTEEEAVEKFHELLEIDKHKYHDDSDTEEMSYEI